MMNKLIPIIIFFAVVIHVSSYAQDPQFSQFFAAPLYLNPGFTGATQEHRFIANYRNQWPGVAGGYNTYAFSYDYNMKDLNSGFGVIATADRAGTVSMGTTNIGFLYSYKIQMLNNWVISPGIQFAYGNKGIDQDNIIMLDQLTYGQANSPSYDPLIMSLGNTNYFDFSSGILVYNKTLWFGYSVNHLNQPDLTMVGDENKLAMKTSIHGGARIRLQDGPFQQQITPSIAPSFIYQRQGNIDQLDFGVNFHYNPIMTGVWYRGIPVMKNEFDDKVTQDALIFLLGLKYKQFEFGYSYDMTVSGLGAAAGNAHEVSVTYKIVTYAKRNKPKRKDKFIPCPTFLLSN